jgi:hypothetical protein
MITDLVWLIVGITSIVLLILSAFSFISKTPISKSDDFDGPMITFNKFQFRSTIAPLFCGKTETGKWRVSLGRTSFWFVLFSFLTMCLTPCILLLTGHDIQTGISAIYISILTMLFLTCLGLLGYNLGKKFTNPMQGFIGSWTKKSEETITKES